MYIDAHSHWSDLRFQELDPGLLLKKSLDLNITQFMLAGVDPEEWQRQEKLDQLYPGCFIKCFGLHPYYISKNSKEVCEEALDQLVFKLNASTGLGETGLDFRESVLNHEDKNHYEAIAHQIEFFENQLQIAQNFKKPVILHIVRAHEKALEVLDLFGDKKLSGMVHAFNGSYETALQYIDRDYFISVGGAVTYEKNKKLRAAVQKLPQECLIIESDCPDQPPEGWHGLNDSSSLWQVATTIGQLRGVFAEDILQLTTNNFKKLFSL